MGQAQSLTKRWEGPGQSVKIWDWTRDGTVQYFESLSCPVPQNKKGQSRKNVLKQEKDVLKQENEVLKQKKGRSKTRKAVLKQGK